MTRKLIDREEAVRIADAHDDSVRSSPEAEEYAEGYRAACQAIAEEINALPAIEPDYEAAEWALAGVLDEVEPFDPDNETPSWEPKWLGRQARAIVDAALRAPRPVAWEKAVGEVERSACTPAAARYLIERGQTENHSPTVWWCGPGAHDFTEDANKAVRFAERDDANRQLVKLYPNPRYRIGRVTAHVFLGACTPAAGEEKCPACGCGRICQEIACPGECRDSFHTDPSVPTRGGESESRRIESAPVAPQSSAVASSGTPAHRDGPGPLQNDDGAFSRPQNSDPLPRGHWNQTYERVAPGRHPSHAPASGLPCECHSAFRLPGPCKCCGMDTRLPHSHPTSTASESEPCLCGGNPSYNHHSPSHCGKYEDYPPEAK